MAWYNMPVSAMHLWHKSVDVKKQYIKRKSIGLLGYVHSDYKSLIRSLPQVTGEVPYQGPVTRSFDVFFEKRLNKPINA